MAELDHIFVLCPAGADAAAQALHRVGLSEGSPNNHAGQGTACRRFFFENAYLELLWVSDAHEAQSEPARRTRLWDRWSRLPGSACPFGIVLRPGISPEPQACPFASWAYRPRYLPSDLSIEFAEATPLEEPEFVYLGFQRGRARAGAEPTAHRIPAHKITSTNVAIPAGHTRSPTARKLEACGLMTFTSADHYSVTVTLDNARSGHTADLHPDAPIILRW